MVTNRYNTKKTRKTKNIRKSKHTRNQRKNRKSRRNISVKRGGAMYGRGYGANCNDPNYSIYNTNMLKLFPYSAK